MNYQKKLIKFMQAKANILPKRLKKRYFDNFDAKILSFWNDETAKEIWGEMKENIADGSLGLNWRLCPFCLYYNLKCSECLYSKNHGVCGSYKSDYIIIVRGINANLLFSNKFYRKIIKGIENDRS